MIFYGFPISQKMTFSRNGRSHNKKMVLIDSLGQFRGGGFCYGRKIASHFPQNRIKTSFGTKLWARRWAIVLNGRSQGIDLNRLFQYPVSRLGRKKNFRKNPWKAWENGYFVAKIPIFIWKIGKRKCSTNTFFWAMLMCMQEAIAHSLATEQTSERTGRCIEKQIFEFSERILAACNVHKVNGRRVYIQMCSVKGTTDANTLAHTPKI